MFVLQLKYSFLVVFAMGNAAILKEVVHIDVCFKNYY